MKIFNFKKIDAFATRNSDGNPAGYIKLDSINDITDKEMLKIAQELKGYVNEVGYVFQVDKSTYKLRYFSSEKEVEFCGHATIAIMYDIIKNDNELIKKSEVNIVTNKGNLVVQNRIEDEDAVFIMSPIPEFNSKKVSKEEVANALKTKISDIDNEPEIVNAGLETLIVSIKSLGTILNLKPKLEELKEFCVKNKIDIIEVFCAEVANLKNAYRTRVFAPTFGYLEDPATGSGNSAFGYYLLKHKNWDGKIISIEQCGEKERYTIVKLKTYKDNNRFERVLFGGGAVVRIEGKYFYYK
ncbi:PhzF family phenazine biosynthesis protein [Herbivorax sp. ANBcel31]|uniref:PhzF family phenazine biosynthesis protein n=1 Tax=Herbivorax sp. ANBcel31 TaxID=3069754 RepID=UPI0027B296EE|nr:PhzF family phenazine biosynthesis protein [Herbivorax sp. ANBcel31]MDQ2086988.1 PhzF family phenazine biosynthesis protein [Herbivorax sp. ANBcel31]